MDSPVCLRDIRALVFMGVGIRSMFKRKESDMNATTVAVDLAKVIFFKSPWPMSTGTSKKPSA